MCSNGHLHSAAQASAAQRKIGLGHFEIYVFKVKVLQPHNMISRDAGCAIYTDYVYGRFASIRSL